MQRGGYRHVPVVDEAGGVVGCVRHKDIVGYLAEHFPRRCSTCRPIPNRSRASGKEGEPMSTATRERRDLESVTILFSGDSGDGMQLTGTQFTNTSAVFGNDVCTMPDYPSEIRAPAGSLAGVSAFQLSFSSRKIHTPGDRPDALVAMNPAALKVYLPRLEPGGVLVVNSDAFSKGNLRKAGYDENPLEDPDCSSSSIPAPRRADHLADRRRAGDSRSGQRVRSSAARTSSRSGCSTGSTIGRSSPAASGSRGSSSRAPADRRGQPTARSRRDTDYGDTQRELRACSIGCRAAPAEPGDYRIINGNEAFALGSVTAARLADKPLVYSSYPITPATDVLHELARLKHFDVRTIQAEDEIAAMGSAIGAAFGGALSLTGTSGPGICLKSEAIGLAIMLELPLVILNVQRGGPSTGCRPRPSSPTCCRPSSAATARARCRCWRRRARRDCFDVAIEAFRIAVRHTTPVIVLSDSYVANGAEPWRIPKFDEARADSGRASRPSPRASSPTPATRRRWRGPGPFPARRGSSTASAGWRSSTRPGNVSHDPENHELMCRMRADKVERIAEFVPEQAVDGPDEGRAAGAQLGRNPWRRPRPRVSRAAARGLSVAHAHLRYLNPFPRNLGALLARYSQVLVPELNGGQLALLLRARFLVDAISVTKVKGRPFTIAEIEEQGRGGALMSALPNRSS